MKSKVTIDDVKRVKGCEGIYRLNIVKDKKLVKTWTTDLTEDRINVIEGKRGKADAKVTLSEKNLMKWLRNELGIKDIKYYTVSHHLSLLGMR